MIHHNPPKNTAFSAENLFISATQQLWSPFCRLLLWLWGGYTATIKINKPLRKDIRYIIAANHQSMADPFAIFALLPAAYRQKLMPVKFMTFPKLYHSPYLKPFMFALGCFPAHAKERHYHTYGVEGSIRLIDRGFNICIFPEGTRTTRQASRPRYGISRILQSQPRTVLLLAHIEWQGTSRWRRHVHITFTEAPRSLNSQDPKAIMDAIYAL